MSSVTLPTLQDALALGLTESEYELICEKQGRAPNQVELAMFSLLWSEHCAYKHSKQLLRTLPTEGEHVVMGPGENAGAVDLGGGLVCAFKVESHNHPSAVEPFQGAATGVGGILRDIFAIGARPIAVLDSLRFGEPGFGLPYPFNEVEEDKGRSGRESEKKQTQHCRDGENGENLAEERSNRTGERSRYLLERAVAGIAHYGNSIGVPTIGGEVYFEGPYEQNCLVNAMALGIGSRNKLVRSAAAGIGNVVVLFGASTGRDGIGGASVLASAELGGQGEDEDKRPTVQVGDPFEGKKLMECSLELLERALIVSLQDLGAAGLTSSASEMASKGGVGIDVDVAKVPLREPDMEPFEIMVSESQERMLCVVEPDKVAQVLALCEKWEVGGAAIGIVTDTARMRVYDGSTLVGDMSVRALVDDCPLYELDPVKPTSTPYPPPSPATQTTGTRDGATAQQTLLALLASPNIASRRPLFEQYDSIVQSRTIRRPEQADAAVLAIQPLGGRATTMASGPSEHGTSESGEPGGHGDARSESIPGIAVSIDCNGRRVAADPYTGTVAAALECASNLACVGAEPLGTTNNLNFGNPEKPHIAWQLAEAVRGLGDACRALAAPIVGGNVSLYNEAAAGPIYPTPVVGMVGRLPDVRRAGRMGFALAGDAIAIVGPFAPSLLAGELAKLQGEPLPDGLPAIDVEAVVAAQQLVREGMRAGVLASAHDVAEGGLAVALAECCLAGALGAQVQLLDGDGDGHADANKEAQGGGDANGGGGRSASVDDGRSASVDDGRSASVDDGRSASVDDGGALELLFGECSGAFVVSGERAALEGLAGATSVAVIGEVGGDVLKISCSHARARVEPFEIEFSRSELAAAHAALGRLFA